MENKVFREGQLVELEEGVKCSKALASLTGESLDLICTMKNGSRQERIKVYNALNSPKERLEEHVNEPLTIVHVLAHEVVLVDEKTGCEESAIRVVLIDNEGVSYVAVSTGVVSSLTNIFNIVGSPLVDSWEDEPITIIPKTEKTRNGNNKVLKLELLEE